MSDQTSADWYTELLGTRLSEVEKRCADLERRFGTTDHGKALKKIANADMDGLRDALRLLNVVWKGIRSPEDSIPQSWSPTADIERRCINLQERFKILTQKAEVITGDQAEHLTKRLLILQNMEPLLRDPKELKVRRSRPTSSSSGHPAQGNTSSGTSGSKAPSRHSMRDGQLAPVLRNSHSFESIRDWHHVQRAPSNEQSTARQPGHGDSSASAASRLDIHATAQSISRVAASGWSKLKEQVAKRKT